MIISIDGKTLNLRVMNEMAEEKGTWLVLKGHGVTEPCHIAIPKLSMVKDLDPKELLQVKRIVINGEVEAKEEEREEEREEEQEEGKKKKERKGPKGPYDVYYCLRILNKNILFGSKWLGIYDGAYAFSYNTATEKTTQKSLVPFGMLTNHMANEEIGKWAPWSDFE